MSAASVYSVAAYLEGNLVVPDDKGRLGAAVYDCMAGGMDEAGFVRLHSGLCYKPFFHVSGEPADERGLLVLRRPVVLFRSLWRECADVFAEGVREGFTCGRHLVPVAMVRRFE